MRSSRKSIAPGEAWRRRRARSRGTARCAAGCGRACGTARRRRCRSPAAPRRAARASTRSSKSIVAVTGLRCGGVLHERGRVLVPVGPVVDDPGRAVAAAGRELEAAVVEHPLQLLVEQEERRERGRVVRLFEARVLDRDRQVEGRGHPARALQAFDAFDRARASTARTRGRRRSRSTSAARSSRRRTRSGSTRIPPAADVPSTTTSASPARAVQVDDHAGRGLVVRVRVHVAVDAVGQDGRLAGRGLAHLRVVEVRRGARDLRELRRELADHEVRAAALDETERGRVPERAWSRRCRAAPRSRRGARTGRRSPSRMRATTERTPVAPVARAEVAVRGRRERGDRLVAHLRRPRSEAAVARAGARAGSRSAVGASGVGLMTQL